MNITELKANQKAVEVTATIRDIGEVREFSNFGKNGRVVNAIIEDESGKMQLTLWNEQIDQVKIGDKVKVSNGYVKEWQGDLQLQSGKHGTLEVIDQLYLQFWLVSRCLELSLLRIHQSP